MWRRGMRPVDMGSWDRQLADARQAFGWLSEGSSSVQQGALRDLRRAFRSWWGCRKPAPTTPSTTPGEYPPSTGPLPLRPAGPGRWSSPRWPDTSTKSAFDVREWTQRVGKESCWEGIDRDASSPMSSNVDAVEIVRSSGKPVRQVANELGIYDSTLGNWVRQDGINRGEREGLTSGERERLRELVRENARLRMERELEKTSCGLLGAGVERVMLYRFVDAQKADGFPVRMVCSVVGVSPSAYYAYRHRPRSGPAQLAEAALGGRDRGRLGGVGWDLWFATGVRRVGSAWPGGEPQTG